MFLYDIVKMEDDTVGNFFPINILKGSYHGENSYC